MIIVCQNCSSEFRRAPSLALKSVSHFCSPACGYKFRRPILQSLSIAARKAQQDKLKATATRRFWGRIAIAGPDECWEWQGARLLSGGYGVTSWGGKFTRAHRIALSLSDGIWDDPRHVCHTCDNPPCCNPAHLWRGTDAENAIDRNLKGRTYRAPLKTHCPHGHEYSEANTLVRRNGARSCRECARKRAAHRYNILKGSRL
jgi:hypothetical protein